MSRIGKKPIAIPERVKISQDKSTIKVEWVQRELYLWKYLRAIEIAVISGGYRG